jgi:REP element-mobilizing transposase RayT
MVEKWWFELAQKNSSIELDEFAVMPDHFHGILILKSPVGEGLCALPSGGSIRRCSPTNSSSLIDIVQWFKTMTTNEYIRGVRNENWLPFTGKLWQRSFYEHIVRNDADLQILREYIQNNPLALEMDAV